MNRKFWYVLLIALIISIPLSFFIKIGEGALLSTIFTINGIMFSIGLGIVSNFNLQGIRRWDYIATIRKNINLVRNSFISFFSVSSFSFILVNLLSDDVFYHYDRFNLTLDLKDILTIFSLFVMVYSIIYFIYNFIKIQDLSQSIFDRILEEENASK
ncbi:hypothetical protein DC081_06500 [Ignatzschineria cameli]|uniref:Uncharacterized protein n=1 Tax=Ignatzschineria cameli TaxID=2182793 RepID=A0A2U2AQC5_9GAMM|nr:hypothetical protein DC077_07165 [Ignatzschineria cameli]PWD89435.1 hypothetical protein DC079_06790 [Ignatzschineria cameli]PWD90907.1 hypothetical protein DC081_06500 [Ignatzschineria cameli]PWD91695.1 hypothetical protein DC078_06785 [Ignatzschineria cameli]